MSKFKNFKVQFAPEPKPAPAPRVPPVDVTVESDFHKLQGSLWTRFWMSRRPLVP